MKKFLPKSFKNPAGFTLVELLVVISIIAILSVIGMTVFSGVQKNARDARRRGDIDAISKALEVNKKDTGYQVLAVTQFAANSIPDKDPQNNAYCGTITPNASAAGMTATTCPPGWAAVSITSPVSTANQTAWTVCTWLENGPTGSGTPGPYCRSNAQ